MEPTIKYTQTEDGVKIAYWSYGEGVPLIVTPYHVFSHIGFEWDWEEQRALLQVPKPLAALIMQLLAKAPEERPQSASAVLDALGAIAKRPSARRRSARTT